jgi:hypothetical protein
MLLCQINNKIDALRVVRSDDIIKGRATRADETMSVEVKTLDEYLYLKRNTDNNSEIIAPQDFTDRNLYLRDMTYEFWYQPSYSVVTSELTKVVAASSDEAVQALLQDILSEENIIANVGLQNKDTLIKKILGVLASLMANEVAKLPKTFEYLEEYLGKTPSEYLGLQEQKTEEELLDEISRNRWSVLNYSGLAASDRLEQRFNNGTEILGYINNLSGGNDFLKLFENIEATNAPRPLVDLIVENHQTSPVHMDLHVHAENEKSPQLPYLSFQGSSVEINWSMSDITTFSEWSRIVIERFKSIVGENENFLEYKPEITSITAFINLATGGYDGLDDAILGQERALLYSLMIYQACLDYIETANRERKEDEGIYFKYLADSIRGNILGGETFLDKDNVRLQAIIDRIVYGRNNNISDTVFYLKNITDSAGNVVQRLRFSQNDDLEKILSQNTLIPQYIYDDEFTTRKNPDGSTTYGYPPDAKQDERGNEIFDPYREKAKKLSDALQLINSPLTITMNDKGNESLARSAFPAVVMHRSATLKKDAEVLFNYNAVTNDFSELTAFNTAYQNIVTALRRINASDPDALANGATKAREDFNKLLAQLKGNLSAQLSLTPVVVDILVSSIIPSVTELDALLKKFEQKVKAAAIDPTQNPKTLDHGSKIEQKILDLFARVNDGENLTAVGLANIWTEINVLQDELDKVKAEYAKFKDTDYKTIDYSEGTVGAQPLNYVLVIPNDDAGQTGAITKSRQDYSFTRLEIAESMIVHTLDAAGIEGDLEALRRFLNEAKAVYEALDSVNVITRNTDTGVFAQLDVFAQSLGEQKLEPDDDYLWNGPQGDDGVKAKLEPLKPSWPALVETLWPLRNRAAEDSGDLFTVGARIVIGQIILQGLPEQLNVGNINKKALAENIADTLDVLLLDDKNKFDANITELQETIQINENLEEVFKRIIGLIKDWFKEPLTEEDTALRSAIDEHPVRINPPKGIEPHVQKMIDDLPQLGDIFTDFNSKYSVLQQFQNDADIYAPDKRNKYKELVLACEDSYKAVRALLDDTYLNDEVRADAILAGDVEKAEALRASLLERLTPHLNNVVEIYKLEAEEKIRDPQSYPAGDLPQDTQETESRRGRYLKFIEETEGKFAEEKSTLAGRFPDYEPPETAVSDLKNIVDRIADAAQAIWKADDDTWQDFIAQHNVVQNLENKKDKSPAEKKQLDAEKKMLQEIKNELRKTTAPNDALNALFEPADKLRLELRNDNAPELKIIEFFYATLVPEKPSVDENVHDNPEARIEVKSNLFSWVNPESPNEYSFNFGADILIPFADRIPWWRGSLSGWWGIGAGFGIRGGEKKYHITLPKEAVMVDGKPVTFTMEAGKEPTKDNVPENIKNIWEQYPDAVAEKVGDGTQGSTTETETTETYQDADGNVVYVENLPKDANDDPIFPLGGDGFRYRAATKKVDVSTGSAPTGEEYKVNGILSFLENQPLDSDGEPTIPVHPKAGEGYSYVAESPPKQTPTGNINWTPGTTDADYGYYSLDGAPSASNTTKWDQITSAGTSGGRALSLDDYSDDPSPSTDPAMAINNGGFVSSEIAGYTPEAMTTGLSPFTLKAPNNNAFQLEITVNGIVVETLKKGASESYTFNLANYTLNDSSDSVNIQARLIGGDSDKTDGETTVVSSAEALDLTVTGSGVPGYYFVSNRSQSTPQITTTDWTKTTTYLYRKSTGTPEMKTRILEYIGTFAEKTPVVKYMIESTSDTQEYQLMLPSEEEDVLQKQLEFRESLLALLRLAWLSEDLKWKIIWNLGFGGAALQRFNSVDGDYSSRVWNYLEQIGVTGEEYKWGYIFSTDFTVSHKVFRKGELSFGVGYDLNTLDDISRGNVFAAFKQEELDLPVIFSWKVSSTLGWDSERQNIFLDAGFGLGLFKDRVMLGATVGSHTDENFGFDDALNITGKGSISIIQTKAVDFGVNLGIGASRANNDDPFRVTPTAGIFLNWRPGQEKKK